MRVSVYSIRFSISVQRTSVAFDWGSDVFGGDWNSESSPISFHSIAFNFWLCPSRNQKYEWNTGERGKMSCFVRFEMCSCEKSQATNSRMCSPSFFFFSSFDALRTMMSNIIVFEMIAHTLSSISRCNIGRNMFTIGHSHTHIVQLKCVCARCASTAKRRQTKK